MVQQQRQSGSSSPPASASSSSPSSGSSSSAASSPSSGQSSPSSPPPSSPVTQQTVTNQVTLPFPIPASVCPYMRSLPSPGKSPQRCSSCRDHQQTITVQDASSLILHACVHMPTQPTKVASRNAVEGQPSQVRANPRSPFSSFPITHQPVTNGNYASCKAAGIGLNAPTCKAAGMVLTYKGGKADSKGAPCGSNMVPIHTRGP